MIQKKYKVAKVIAIFILIVILIYLLILKFGNINNRDLYIPTGNVDIFEINCNHKDIDKDKNENNEENTDTSNEIGNIDIDKNKPNKTGVIVSDDYSIWGNKKLRIFSNPAYQYTSKIAPNSSNSYVFVVRNNNDFDIVVDFDIVEENNYDINMKYKLRSKGTYLVGNENTYEDVSKLNQQNITIKAKESISYILDWKWIDSENDTEIGETIDTNYKLTINIGANQKYN
ncbi:MAG: hypothetical protein ACLR1U_05880 [Clostridia bacterium]